MNTFQIGAYVYEPGRVPGVVREIKGELCRVSYAPEIYGAWFHCDALAYQPRHNAGMANLQKAQARRWGGM